MRCLNLLMEKFKEVVLSVLPITVIVLILHFTITPLEPYQLVRFLIGLIFVIVGLAIFLAGVDIGITPMGNLLGGTLFKTSNMWKMGIGALLLGFFISIAEPALVLLAEQVDMVSSGSIPKFTLIVVVSVGIAIMMAIGMLRMVYNVPLYKLLTVCYLLILVFSFFATPEFLAISFDASGATTGALAVPFMLSLAIGVSVLKKDSKAAEKDSFGLVGVASVGPILSVIIMSLFAKSEEITATLDPEVIQSTEILPHFFKIIPGTLSEVGLSLAPLVIIFIVLQFATFKLHRRAASRIIKGQLYAFIGLVLFLVGVNGGFMDVGRLIGQQLARLDNPVLLIIVAFVLGFVTILAEPSVHVLTRQIEEVTGGTVKRRAVLASLSIGVGIAIALSIVRILVPQLMLWHYLLPGYAIAIALSYIVPKMFVGMSFDSGGVATGPMTATFILAFTQGSADAVESANILVDGFGVIAMVALTPIITLQVLGFIHKIKSRRSGGSVDEL